MITETAGGDRTGSPSLNPRMLYRQNRQASSLFRGGQAPIELRPDRRPATLACPAGAGRTSASASPLGEFAFHRPCFFSPADWEYLQEILSAFELEPGQWNELPFCGPERPLSLPIGVARTDAFLDWLQQRGRNPSPERLLEERRQLVQRLATKKPPWANRRLAVYSEEAEFVTGAVSLLLEAGMLPVFCGSAADAGRLRLVLKQMTPELPRQVAIESAAHIEHAAEAIQQSRPEVLVAGPAARELAVRTGVPWVAAGGSVCKADSGEQILHIGYRGGLQMLQRIEAALGAAAAGVRNHD